VKYEFIKSILADEVANYQVINHWAAHFNSLKVQATDVARTITIKKRFSIVKL
jgi:hypothetical protein